MLKNPSRGLPPPPGLQAISITIAGEGLLVLSFEIAPPELPSILSDGERDVARRLLDGDTYEQVATARGSSRNTVANQVANIYRKLGVRSVSELADLTGSGRAGSRPRVE